MCSLVLHPLQKQVVLPWIARYHHPRTHTHARTHACTHTHTHTLHSCNYMCSCTYVVSISWLCFALCLVMMHQTLCLLNLMTTFYSVSLFSISEDCSLFVPLFSPITEDYSLYLLSFCLRRLLLTLALFPITNDYSLILFPITEDYSLHTLSPLSLNTTPYIIINDPLSPLLLSLYLSLPYNWRLVLVASHFHVGEENSLYLLTSVSLKATPHTFSLPYCWRLLPIPSLPYHKRLHL